MERSSQSDSRSRETDGAMDIPFPTASAWPRNSSSAARIASWIVSWVVPRIIVEPMRAIASSSKKCPWGDSNTTEHNAQSDLNLRKPRNHAEAEKLGRHRET